MPNRRKRGGKSRKQQKQRRAPNWSQAPAVQPVLAPEFAAPDQIAADADDPQDVLQADFEQYDRDNPQVYAAFKAKAHQLRREGRAKLSGKYIVERLRWDTPVGADHPRDFKLTNSYTSRYVRKLIADDPTFAPYFRLRPLGSELAKAG